MADSGGWYYAKDGQSYGLMTLDELRRKQATLTGPGEVWLQSLPFSRLAGRIVAAAPQTGRGGKEEGSILGGLGRLLDGDNQ